MTPQWTPPWSEPANSAFLRLRAIGRLGRQAADHGLDPIERGDACEGLLGDRGVAALSDLVEPAPDVGPAIGKGYRTAVAGRIGQRLVGAVGVHLEDATEPGQRPDGVLGAATRRVEIGDRRRIGTTPRAVVAGDRPEVTGLGPLA